MIDNYFKFCGSDSAGGRTRSDASCSRLYWCVLTGVWSSWWLLRHVNRFRTTWFRTSRCYLVTIVSFASSFYERHHKHEIIKIYNTNVSQCLLYIRSIYYLILRPLIALSLVPRLALSSDLFEAVQELETCQAYRRSPRYYYPCAARLHIVSESVD